MDKHILSSEWVISNGQRHFILIIKCIRDSERMLHKTPFNINLKGLFLLKYVWFERFIKHL